MKRVLAVIITVLMLFQSVALAADPYVYDVTTNITLEGKAGGSSDEYSDLVSIESGEYVDFEAKIDMASVREEFETILSILNTMHPAKDDEIKDLVLSGTFSLVLEYDSVLKLADSVVNGKNMDGFSASAKKAFVETKRTISVGTSTSTLTIDLKIKNGLTVDELSDNVDTYLADMSFAGSAKNVVKAGGYSFSGNMTGAVNAVYTNGDNTVEGAVNFANEATPVVNVEVTPATYNVTGAIANITTDDTVTATLNGDDVVVNADGTFEIEDVAAGNYTLVVTKNGTQTMTVMVTVADADVTLADITFPAANISTNVDVDTSVDVTVGKLEEITGTIIGNIDSSAEIGGSNVNDLITNEEAKVEITTTVTTTNVLDEILDFVIDKAKEIIEEITDKVIAEEEKGEIIKRENLAKVETTVEVTKEGEEAYTETVHKVETAEGEKKPMHFVVSFDTWGKENFVVFSQSKADESSDAVVETLTQATTGEAGTYTIDEENGLIHIYTESATADFAVAYTEIEDVVVESDPEEDDSEEGGTPSKPVIRPSENGGSTGTKPSGSFTGVANAALYSDITTSHWAYDYVEKMAQTGIMNGIGNQKFDPEGELTRASVVKMLASLVKAEVAVTKVPFIDVPESAWHNAYVAWGLENGIVTGYSETEFAPDKSISREEIAAMIIRFMDKFGVKYEAVVAKAAFADDAAIQSYAYDAVYALQQAGVFNGKENNVFDPQNVTTRAEAAKIFSIVYDIYNK